MRFLSCLALSLVTGCVVRSTTTPTEAPTAVPSRNATVQPVNLSPYAVLRSAYTARDANLAASAYALDARLAYEGGPEGTTVYEGRDAIRASFGAFFNSVDQAHPLDLNFRLTGRIVRGAMLEEHGIYRLHAGRAFTSYGRFEVVRDTASGRFLSDVSRPATRADFEGASGPVLLAPGDEKLDLAYYDALTGRYRRPDGCDLVVTSSVVRLFVRDVCTQTWRGLSRVSGRTWTAGDHVLSDLALATFRFAAPDPTGTVASLTVEEKGYSIETVRDTPYRTEPLTFAAPDGARLAGTLYLPSGPGRHPAVVLVHGSGPQDRRGYASIIAVLAYDKRGVLDSEGEGGSFAVLGADAAAALNALRRRPDVDPARAGLAGSSQAGWVVAKAIEGGAAPAAVFLLGAAGAALDVPEQNRWRPSDDIGSSGLIS